MLQGPLISSRHLQMDHYSRSTDMQEKTAPNSWDHLSHKEKNHVLYLKQKELLDQFLANGAISQAQYDKSFHDLTEKMGENKNVE